MSTNAGADSTKVVYHVGANAPSLKYRSYVNTGDCRQLRSDSYIVALGAGGGNMKLQCPPDHPVLYNWNMDMNFMPFPPIFAIVGGKGNTTAVCCAVAHKWEA
jgi:hypothetical protein